MQSLEARCLLATQLAIDFTSEAAPHVQAGYHADIGRAFGARGRIGETFGWSVSNELYARNPDAANSPESRYDTFNHLRDDVTWSAVVPKGWYSVRIVAGDPKHTDSAFRIDAEGVRVVEGMPTKQNPWVDGSAIVEVTDGLLTVNAEAGGNDKLAFLEITPAAVPNSVTPSVDWSSAPKAPIGRVEPAVLQVGSKVYVMGGFDGDLNVNRRVDIFDLETEKWSTGAQLPSGAALTHGGAVTDGTFIYLISGQPGSGFGAATSRSFRYHLATNTWSEWISFPTKRYGGATAYVDGKIYYFGGAKEDRTTLSKAYWSIDTKAQNPQWKYLGEMPLTGDHVGHAVIGGKIYIVGGEHGHEGLNGIPKGTYIQHDYLLEYDPATDKFTRKADMLTAASHFEASIHVINNRIVVFGGNDRIESQTNKVQLYDPRTNKWQYLNSPVPDARQGPASGVWKGRIYYTNGYSSSLGVTTTAYWGTLRNF